MEMPLASNKTTSLRAMYDAIEQLLRSLHSLGEDTIQRQIVSLIRSKLPKVVTVLLEQEKGTENEWTVTIQFERIYHSTRDWRKPIFNKFRGR